jgi:putative component of toxin-antitoxin plasmid stabilization module
VNYEIVELEDLSGFKTGIYSVLIEDVDGNETTLLDRFVNENIKDYGNEVEFILDRLSVMGKKVGARIDFFKEGEGHLGDGVCALYDEPSTNLRLYCIRYGNVAIILGGGGPKSKSIRAYQKDDKLRKEADLIKQISKDITQRIREKEIWWSADGKSLLGNLTFTDNEDE